MKKGIFDTVVNKDSSFFINILRLKDASVDEFRESYQRINNYFSDIATLLDAADSISLFLKRK